MRLVTSLLPSGPEVRCPRVETDKGQATVKERSWQSLNILPEAG